ncbi:MAG TPA: 16S rRNA (guanine(527)-N(7))-methyltransferase RsmG [Caulobacteraceae bacterium]
MSDVAAPLDAPAAFLRSLGVSPGRLADVDRFRLILEDANSRMNLVGASTIADFWRRHFLDSAQLLSFAPEVKTWADLGSGAGFPGIILAILLKDAPETRIHLVESVTKRCRFLDEVVRELDLPAIVHNARAESLALKVDIVTARACAPLTRLLGFAKPSFGRRTKGLFLKGAEVDSELAEARKSWRFDVVAHPSLSDPRGRVLEITELARVR